MEGPERGGAPGLVAPDRLDLPLSDPLASRLFPLLPTGVHWGLERTLGALDALGDPHLRYPTLHVGGTNGKGSVAATLASVLSSSGLRAACYTSPHLCSFRERVAVNGAALGEDVLLARAEEVRDSIVRFGLTFFEAATVLAFHAFAREGVDIAVVEVGLGGRLDATNVIRPLVTAVTNVALDHAEFLGSTLAEIAREKAGIMKAGVPFVTAETEPALLDLFHRIAEERGATVHGIDASRVVRDLEVAADHTSFTLLTRLWGDLSIRTPLVGRHQATNAAVAVAVLEHLPPGVRPGASAVLDGVRRVAHPGRDQVEVLDGRTWLFDVAHNTAGIQSLVDTMDSLDLPRPLVALVGVLGDKDWRSMLPPLLARADHAVLTQPPSAPADRLWDPVAASELIAHVCPVQIEEDFPRALERAAAQAGKGTVVVTGSCHTVGSALAALRMEPLRER